MEKEEHAIILDFLPYGYPLENKMMPIAQAIGDKNSVLLQLVPRRGIKLEVGERVYIGEGKREKVYYILGKLPENKLTETTKQQLQEFIEKQIGEDEEKFVEFFNKIRNLLCRISLRINVQRKGNSIIQILIVFAIKSYNRRQNNRIGKTMLNITFRRKGMSH